MEKNTVHTLNTIIIITIIIMPTREGQQREAGESVNNNCADEWDVSKRCGTKGGKSLDMEKRSWSEMEDERLWERMCVSAYWIETVEMKLGRCGRGGGWCGISMNDVGVKEDVIKSNYLLK